MITGDPAEVLRPPEETYGLIPPGYSGPPQQTFEEDLHQDDRRYDGGSPLTC